MNKFNQRWSRVAAALVITGSMAFCGHGYLFTISLVGYTVLLLYYEVLLASNENKQKKVLRGSLEKERLRVSALESQLDALRKQVDPHFLFNSLNVLDSLIEDEPQKARIFVEELSSVYRYLLRSSEQQLVELHDELSFIRSYFHLLKTRLGQGLELYIRVDSDFENCKIPPLTLQLLLENAVRHNMILPDQPLVTEILTDSDGHLQVRNNMQRKNAAAISITAGLTGLFRKYQALGLESPTIREQEGKFAVTIPLIDPAAVFIFPSTS
jgi:two-component system LytT family sensor kinase